MPDRLSAEQSERYQAHLALARIGVAGQARLLRARVLLLGVGGLGCPAALYLTAAGVGSLGLLDDDIIDRTNLQRQILFGPADLGARKAEVAAERLASLNPDVELRPIIERLTAGNAASLVAGWDVVIDGSDNFATRYIVNDACVLAGIPLVSGSIYQFEGQVTVIRTPAGPCYRCLFPSPPPEQAACRDAGVLAPLPGMVGSIQAAETIKLVVGEEASLIGRLLLVDALASSFRSVNVRRNPGCPLCGESPTIRRPTAVAVCRGPVD
ncbi:MAG: ThiF family adenylyltransferase [Acidobacteriota bacterium]